MEKFYSSKTMLKMAVGGMWGMLRIRVGQKNFLLNFEIQ